MRVVALLAVRNEELYLQKCLEHLESQGVETCLIDNGSTDRTIEIAKSFSSRGVFRIENIPFNGIYEWRSILALKENLAMEIEADWFIHHDADEIREAPRPYKTLLEGITDADRLGYNAINFDEFVFLPTNMDESFEGKDYVSEMKHYFFLEPRKLNRINAWKKRKERVNLNNSDGHRVQFDGIRIFPAPFVLRHYVVLSRIHALRKYGNRVFSMGDVVKHTISKGGTPSSRVTFSPQLLNFPGRDRLKVLSSDGLWDKSDKWRSIEFLGKNTPPWIAALKKDQDRYTKNRNKHNPLDRIVSLFFRTSGVEYLPIPFIVGLPATGTSLLRFALNSHPEMAIIHETRFVPQPEENLHCTLKHINRSNPSDVLRHFYKSYAEGFGKKRAGDATGNYINHIYSIQKLLPEAHFIHLIRDGRDLTSLSKIPINDIEMFAADWLSSIRNARHQAQLSKQYMEIKYEDLVESTQKTLKNICAFIKVEYDPRMERNIQLAPDHNRIQIWKKEMGREEREKFESIAGEMLTDLGYEVNT